MWADLAESLAKEVAYVPLDNENFLRLHGSKVTSYTETPPPTDTRTWASLGSSS